MNRTTLPDPAGLLARRAQALRRHFARAVKGDAAAVHQCRVASRRLREAVPVLTAGRDDLDRGRTRRALRRLTRTLGTLRELDVTLNLIYEMAGRRLLPARALDDVRAHVEQERARHCEQQMKRLARLDAKRLAKRLAATAEAVRAMPPAAWHKTLAARLVSRSRALATAARDAGHLYEPDRLHRVRIAGKKLRYALELALESGVPAAREPVRRLRMVQDILGRLHDLQVLQAHVASVEARRPPHASQDDLARVARSLEDECRHLHAKYLSMAPALDAIVRDTRSIAAGAARSRRGGPLKAALAGRSRDARQPRAAGA